MYFKKPVEKKTKYLCTDWIFCNFSGILPHIGGSVLFFQLYPVIHRSQTMKKCNTV